jgi:phenylacetate-CoA ligase
MNFAVKYLSSVMYQLRQKRVLQLEKEFSNRQWCSTEDLYRFGDERARSLAIHAAENVPYYRKLFNSLNIDPTSMTLSEDWNRLPILEKDTLRAKYNDLISETAHSKKARPNNSGGSTGKPVSFLSDLRLYEIMAANMRLIFSWAGWRPGDMVLHLWGGGDKKLPLAFWVHIKALLNGYLVLPVYSYDENFFMRWWEVLKKYEPTIIYAYPSVAADFSRWLEGRGYQPKSVKGVFCSAEVLFPNHRNVIERVFNCKVFNQYGSRETPCVACECPEGNMHLFLDLNRVEFLDQPENPSGPKRIIVTPYENYAQPLLRYDLGDFGAPKEGMCPCGRGFPLMEMNLGRENDHVRALDGRIIYPSFLIHLLDGKKWIRRFQFRQVKPDGLELVMEADSLPDIQEHVNRLASEMLPHLQAKMGAGIKLNIRAVPFIERTSAGKHRFVINEIEENK